ncbi:hypothetical protein GASC598B02_008440, partial [Gilliamella apicola SCGC AB-598-B02]
RPTSKNLVYGELALSQRVNEKKLIKNDETMETYRNETFSIFIID